MVCDFCKNTEYKLGVYPIGRAVKPKRILRGNKVYHLGSGIRMQDPEATEKILLRRNYPDVDDGTQTGAVFVPETFLPTISKYGITPIETNIELFQDNLLSIFPDEKDRTIELGRFKGSVAEMSFYEELKEVFKEKEVFILHGYSIREERTSQNREIDFIIINKKFRYVMVLEIKYSLYRGKKASPCENAIHQLKETKKVLEGILKDLQLQQWKIVGAVAFMEHSINEEQRIRCCEECKMYVIQKGEMKSFFGFEDYMPDNTDAEGYKKVISRILFTEFASPHPILRYDIDEAVADKILEQGKCQNIIFWTPSQLNLVQLDGENVPRFKNVLFTSSFSTGKTEVMRYVMWKLVKMRKKCHFIVCNTTKLIPLLFLQFITMVEDMELEYEYIQISLVQNHGYGSGSSMSKDLKQLSEKVAEFPNHYTFIDEFVVNFKNDDESMVKAYIEELKILTKV